MSITFSIEGIREEQGYELPCTGCGVSAIAALTTGETRHRECPVCDGYGGASGEDQPQPRYELNVANLNGAELLDFLGLPVGYSGEVPGAAMVLSLACNSARRYKLCRDTVQDGNVITHGRNREQVDYYFRVLNRIAKKATQYNRNVVWQ